MKIFISHHLPSPTSSPTSSPILSFANTLPLPQSARSCSACIRQLGAVAFACFTSSASYRQLSNKIIDSVESNHYNQIIVTYRIVIAQLDCQVVQCVQGLHGTICTIANAVYPGAPGAGAGAFQTLFILEHLISSTMQSSLFLSKFTIMGKAPAK